MNQTSMTEKKFYTNRIKPLLDGVQGLEYNRIEVKGLARGIPDITYSFNGHHGWIELKYVNKIVKPNYKFKLTRELTCLLYTSPSPRDLSTSRMPSSA